MSAGVDDEQASEEAELTAFLQGHDALSQRIRRLPQAQPPQALSAQIIAQVERALQQEQAAAAAAAVDAADTANTRTPER